MKNDEHVRRQYFWSLLLIQVKLIGEYVDDCIGSGIEMKIFVFRKIADFVMDSVWLFNVLREFFGTIYGLRAIRQKF